MMRWAASPSGGVMSALEESLRRALNLGDAADPEYRLSIYQASERALEKMLAEKAVPGNEAQPIMASMR